jgi:hypothetical protein
MKYDTNDYVIDTRNGRLHIVGPNDPLRRRREFREPSQKEVMRFFKIEAEDTEAPDPVQLIAREDDSWLTATENTVVETPQDDAPPIKRPRPRRRMKGDTE